MSTSRLAAFASPALRTASTRRCIHTTATAAAAKRRKADFDGDMFAGQSSGPKVRESYSFGGAGSATLQSLTEKTKKATEEAADAVAAAGAKTAAEPIKPKKKTSKDLRREEYESQLAYARSLLRSDVHWKRKIVRRGILRKLTMLADDPEQLRHVAALFPDWAHAGYTLDDDTAETYIGRCVTFKKPQIAVTLLLNAQKHKFHLPSLPVARKLLKSLVENGSTLRNLISYVSLYNAYNLPPAISDPATCALIIEACIKDGSPEAIEIGREFSKLPPGVSTSQPGVQSTRLERDWRGQFDTLSATLAALPEQPSV